MRYTSSFIQTLPTYLFLSIFLLFLGYQSFAQTSLNIDLIFHWEDSTIASDPDGQRYNEVWGFVQDGREYGVIGSGNGTHIFDVTDTSDIHLVDFIAGTDDYYFPVHRDYHDYQGYLYIVCDEGNTMQIADLSTLPDSVTVVYDSDTLYSGAHNIFIDTAKGLLYTLAGQNFSTFDYFPMRVYSLTDPLDPEFLYEHVGPFHVHDAYVREDIAFLNNGNEGLQIMDFSSPAAPFQLSEVLFYPESGYNHSGWTTDDFQYYVFADENHGHDIKVFDISDLTAPALVSTFNNGVADSSMPHNILIDGRIAYVSYYHDGLYIFNLNNPSAPEILGYYDTYPFPHYDFWKGAWGVYPHLPSGKVLVSDTHTGFFVLDASAAKAVSRAKPKHIQNSRYVIFRENEKDVLWIKSKEAPVGKITIELCDLSGKALFNQTKPCGGGQFETSLTLNHLSPGLYVATVVDAAGSQVQKFLLTK